MGGCAGLVGGWSHFLGPSYESHDAALIPGRERLKPEMLPHPTPWKPTLLKPFQVLASKEKRAGSPTQTISTSTPMQ